MTLQELALVVGITVGVVGVLGGLGRGAIWIINRRRSVREERGLGDVKPSVPSHTVPVVPAAPDDQEKLQKYRRAVSYLDDLVSFRRRWAVFEERLLALIELFEEGYYDSEEFDEICDKLASDRGWLKTRLINLRRDRLDIEGSSAEISNAERELLQHDFRRGRMCRRFFDNYHYADELEGDSLYDLDQPRRVVRDAALALDAAIQRLDREAEELYEDARMPGDPPYQSRVK
jgi:hypothetical protein